MSELPADREKALDAIANGWSRTPTLAHPECLCGRAERTDFEWRELCGDWFTARRRRVVIPCPVHPKARR